MVSEESVAIVSFALYSQIKKIYSKDTRNSEFPKIPKIAKKVF